MSGTHGIGHTRMATEIRGDHAGRASVLDRADQCLVHNGSLSNHNDVRRELIREGMTFETAERHRGRGRLSHLANCARAPSSARRLNSALERSRRLLHLRRRHRNRFRRAARSGRLQAGGDGRDRAICRFRLGISRAGRFARHRQARICSSPNPRKSISGSARHERRIQTRRTGTGRFRSGRADLRELERHAAGAGRRHQRDPLAHPQSARRACAWRSGSTRRSPSRSTATPAITAPA